MNHDITTNGLCSCQDREDVYNKLKRNDASTIKSSHLIDNNYDKPIKEDPEPVYFGKSASCIIMAETVLHTNTYYLTRHLFRHYQIMTMQLPIPITTPNLKEPKIR